MTEIQKTYQDVIRSIDGRKKSIKDILSEETSRIGNAGIAIAISVLDDGEIKIQHLVKRIPDFKQGELRTALSRLQKNGYLRKTKEGYKIVIDDDVNIDDGIWWALLGAVANGWIERTNKK